MRPSPLIPVIFAFLAVHFLAAGLMAQDPPLPDNLPPELLERIQAMRAKRTQASPVPAVVAASATVKQRPRLVFGEVVDADGKPIAGVGVTLGSLESIRSADCLEKPLARTDAKGRFEFVLAPPPVVPKVPAKPAAPPPEPGPLTRDLADAKASEALTMEIEKALGGAHVDADLAYEKALAEVKQATEARKKELELRKYLVLCGEEWLSMRVTMPTVDHTAMQELREPKDAKERAARVGLDVMARIWGRASEPKKDGVDLKKFTLRPGVELRGVVTDAAGEPVAGARITARDLLTAGRFRGISGSNSKRWFGSYATSGEDGRFRLPGVFRTGSQIAAKKKGFFEISMPVVGAEEELRIALGRSSLQKGRVLTQKGEPATATVTVRYELSSVAQAVKVGKDGAFEFHPKFPHRFRLSVRPSGTSATEHTTTYSPVLDGAGKNVVITLAKKKAKPKPKKPKKRASRLDRWGRIAKQGFAVSVVDALTSRPLKDFEAAAVWVRANYNATESYFQSRFNSKKRKSKQPGYVRLPGPANNSTPKGAVIVKAKGYATFVQLGLEFDPDRLPRIVAEMVPESILGGVVHDSVSGEPVGGATVRLYPLREDGRTGRVVNAKSDTGGRFLFKGLGRGRYRFLVSYKSRTVNPITVDLDAEEKRADVRLTLRPAFKLTGKVVGVKPGEMWPGRKLQVELLNEQTAMSMMYNPGYQPTGIKTDLNEDGTFEFKGVSPNFYEVCLVIPRDKRHGPALKIPIEPVRVRRRDAHVVVDASEDLPGRLGGKIAMTGAKLDCARLLVVVTPFVPRSPYYYYGSSNVDLSGSRSRVAADGTFGVDVTSGKKTIKVIDVITGVELLSTEEPIQVDSGAKVSENVELALTEVIVKLKPAQEGDKIAASWLNIDVERPTAEALRMFVFFSSSNNKRATGISLVGRGDSIRLILPPHKSRFQVFSNVALLSRAKSKPRGTLGEGELTPKLGEKNEVTIEVSRATSGFDPVPVEDKVDEDLGDGEGQTRKDKRKVKPAAPAEPARSVKPAGKAAKGMLP